MRHLHRLGRWIDARLPVLRFWREHFSRYFVPKNLNFWYCFGVLSLLVMVIQLFSGLVLAMNYVPTPERAQASIELFSRDVAYGWLIRYLHSVGASMLFVVVFLHLYRALIYGSYKKPRELVWVFGMLILLVLMAEAFTGYVLPWGQMSYWGTQVIISLFDVIPVIGEDLANWIRGDYQLSGVTLNRFFAWHVIGLPLLLLVLTVLHIIALHEVGSNNPDGVEIRQHQDKSGKPVDGIPLHPYYTVKDLYAVAVFMAVFLAIVFYAPDMGGYFLERANFEAANPSETPEDIAPLWYFMPFYSILRAVPHTFWGVVAFVLAIMLPFLLPWLDRSPIKSWRYRSPVTALMLVLFASAFVILGALGARAVTPERVLLARVCTGMYFAFFLLMPWWSVMGRTRAVPERVTMDGGMGLTRTIIGLLLIAVLVAVPLKAVGAAAASDCGDIACEPFTAAPDNTASLREGATLYMRYCFSCHSLGYMRYGRLMQDLRIAAGESASVFQFDADKMTAKLMASPMTAAASTAAFGTVAPDLSITTRARSPEWVYTFLMNFYADDSRPLGVNNRVFAKVSMPHVLQGLQGLPVCSGGDACERLIRPEAGSLSAAEFERVVYDIVNFLAYVAEPDVLKRQRLGRFVLLYAALFLVLAWLLKREYWKDID
ncbi:MAG: ubiquinol-cytochrome C reductase [Gammaproteobacteria bacterium]|nr:MAG: ubiquinol-cytochrome C reductase [Gammaproteobacteria bacterium]